MGRPSVKEERRAPIFDAYESCVARYGVEGATLERIAQEADLARPLIRHNLGNREELLEALVARFETTGHDFLKEIIAELPQEDPLESLIEWLFDPAYADSKAVLVSDALITAANARPWLARRMETWTETFVEILSDAIANAHPRAKESEIQTVAVGITAIYFTVDSLSLLGPMGRFHQSAQEACHLLLKGLDRA